MIRCNSDLGSDLELKLTRVLNLVDFLASSPVVRRVLKLCFAAPLQGKLDNKLARVSRVMPALPSFRETGLIL